MGGDGRVSGLVLAVMILQVISTGVNLLRMDPFFILAMWGFIVLVIIAANHPAAGSSFSGSSGDWVKAAGFAER